MEATPPIEPTAPIESPGSIDAPRPVDATRAPAPARVPAWVVVLPVVALLATAVLWYRTNQELGEIRARLDAMDRSPTLDVSGAPAMGPAGARVVLVEFSDYECPFCIRHTRETMPLLQANYIDTGRIGYVFRDYPIDQLHPQAIRAHEAGRCAADQNKFWEMHKRLFSPAGTHTPEQLAALASTAGLNVPDFQSCLASGRHTADIRKTAAIAEGFGASGTPVFFIGLRDPETGVLKLVDSIGGAQPYEAFAKTLDTIIQRAR